MRTQPREGRVIHRPTRIAPIIAAALATACPAARAGTVTLVAARDNTLYQHPVGARSNGAGQHFFAGQAGPTTGTPVRRGLLAFDLAGQVPPGHAVTSATLTLHMSMTIAGPQDVTLHRLSADWGEGASNAPGEEGAGTPALAGDATWLHRFFNTTFWATPGGDFVAASSASASVDGIGFYTWSPTPQMTADVQQWLSSPSTNFGWLVRGVEGTPMTAKRFDSRDHLTAAVRPMLTIVFVPDCNGNGTDDSQDIAGGGSADCNANGTPDECEPDGDGDGTIDACDGCPGDPAKIALGVCGCGVPDTDGDGDGTANCIDACPMDGAKTAPGICGCGVPDTDSDGDGAADCDDLCPGQNDFTNADGDSLPDCLDGCPDDPLKTVPGLFGCGVPEADTDADGVPDSVDQCPGANDNIDTDHDATPDCLDGCPNDENKTAPGVCGCGTADADADGDGAADCHDGCPNDAAKVAPGACGCGIADTDADGDGTADCADGCPSDAAKIAPGACGCGNADVDRDGDAAADCNDACPDDPLKTAPGRCGCGVIDAQRDADCNLIASNNTGDPPPPPADQMTPPTCGLGAGCAPATTPAAAFTLFSLIGWKRRRRHPRSSRTI